MSSRIGRAIRPIKMLVAAGLIVWGGLAWWTIREARRAGAVLGDSLTAAWPEQGAPQFGTRRKLLDAAADIEAGAFRTVTRHLGPTRPPTPDERIAAPRFFAQAQPLRKRFLAAASAAQAEEADVSVVRDALARALAAATKNDEARVTGHVEIAERALEELDAAGETGIAAGDAEAVVALVRRIGPTFDLGRELLTEGHAAVEKLVARASWHFQAKEYRQAGLLLNLAAGLLDVEPSDAVAPVTPEWFDALAQSPPASGSKVDHLQAQEAVELAQAMAVSVSPSKAVTGLVEKARRELKAERPAEAHWWASVALSAMGMTAEAIAQATDTSKQENPEPSEE